MVAPSKGAFFFYAFWITKSWARRSMKLATVKSPIVEFFKLESLSSITAFLVKLARLTIYISTNKFRQTFKELIILIVMPDSKIK